MGIFNSTTAREQRDHDQVIALEKRVHELEHELAACQRRVDQVDLHAKVIVEEAKRLITKFERRLDRETPPEAPQSRQDAPGRTIAPSPTQERVRSIMTRQLGSNYGG